MSTLSEGAQRVIITLTGENNLLLRNELSEIVGEFRSKNGDLNIEQIDGSSVDYQVIVDSLESISLFSPSKLVILNEPSKIKAAAEDIEALLAKKSDQTDLIIVEPKLDKRGSFFKYLKKATDFREFHELEANDLAKWAVDYAKVQSAILSIRDASYLIDRVGANQLQVKQEIDKLVLFDPKITTETIDLLTEESPQSSIFELIEASLSATPSKITKLYDEQMAQRVDPQQIIALLAWQLHVMALAKAAGASNLAELAKDSGVSAYPLNKAKTLVSNISFSELTNMIDEAVELDKTVKTKPVEARDTVYAYLLSLNQQVTS